MTDKELLELALEALKTAQNNLAPSRGSAHAYGDGELWDKYAKSITAIKEALAQRDSIQAKPEPEQKITHQQAAQLINEMSAQPKEPEQDEKFCDNNCVWTDHHPDCRYGEPNRHELQAKGEHPAPCARFCEANAFQIEIRSLKKQLEEAQNGWCKALEKLQTHQTEQNKLAYYEKVADDLQALCDKQSLRIAELEAQPEQEPVAWTENDMAYRPNGLPQEFIHHEVESHDDWSEWVCPKPEQYFLKCCDCGLVHEAQFRVAKYGEGDYCELVEDKDTQAQFRMRRRTNPQQRTWVGLTDEEKEHTWKIAEAKGWGWQKMFDHLEAKLKEKNT